MTRITEAIFSGGVLRPTEQLNLREQQRVRIIVQTFDEPAPEDRAAAMRELREGIARMGFRSNGAYPSRDELHERG